MKYFFLALALLLIKGSCINESQSSTVTFVYNAESRGFFNKITINETNISVQHKKEGELKTITCPEASWENLMVLLEGINVKELSSLEAPSKSHQSDAAAIAHLTIIIDDKVYETQSFDHGNPPKTINLLVKQILSLVQNIE